MDVGSFPHQVTRLVFDTGQPYDQFRARYEAAVPALDETHLAGFARGSHDNRGRLAAAADRWYRNSPPATPTRKDVQWSDHARLRAKLLWTIRPGGR